jgi:hypothetical protein
MHFDEQQMLTLSRELWATHLGLSIDPLQGSDAESEERTWASCVKVTGPWHGAILLECPESIVRHAAVMLFAADGDSEDDIEDAAKELADMFGKKLQSLLPQASKISRPSIVVDRSESKALNGMQDLRDYTFHCEGRPVRIVLFEGEPEVAAAG